MPGIVLNPIASNASAEPPYVPTYDSIYVASWQTYQVSGSTTGGTEGGIAKMNFSGSVSASWMASANTAVTGSQKSVRFAAGARDYVLADARNTVTGSDYREVRLIDKATGTIVSSSGNYEDLGGSLYGMRADYQEKYIYAFGATPVWPSGSTVQSNNGIVRIPHSSILPDQQFRTNIGDGPIIPGTPKQVHDIFLNKKGKIGVCHNGNNWDNNTGKYHNFVVLNSNGTVDTSFDFGSAQFKQGASTLNNGATDACRWIESGSSGVWLVAGKFDNFGTSSDSASYDKIMAFNEDGSINTEFTYNLRTVSGIDYNGDINDIVQGANNYYMILGGFTSPNKKINSISGDGQGQAGMNNNNYDARLGVAYNNQLYWVFEGTGSTDNTGTERTSKSMGAIDVYSFNNTSYFDIGAGIETNTSTAAQPGSIFLG